MAAHNSITLNEKSPYAAAHIAAQQLKNSRLVINRQGRRREERSSFSNNYPEKSYEKSTKSEDFVLFGGDKRDRTADLLTASQALSQLSYTPICSCRSARNNGYYTRGLRICQHQFFIFFNYFFKANFSTTGLWSDHAKPVSSTKLTDSTLSETKKPSTVTWKLSCRS